MLGGGVALEGSSKLLEGLISFDGGRERSEQPRSVGGEARGRDGGTEAQVIWMRHTFTMTDVVIRRQKQRAI